MPCAKCGHDRSFHGNKLNHALCPVTFVDGECTAPGKGRELTISDEKTNMAVGYALMIAARKPTRWLSCQSNPQADARNQILNAARNLIGQYGGYVCGCTAYVEDL